MNNLDIHSHILPFIDDGAKSVQEGIELLKEMKKQGITQVVATPHFDPSVHDIDTFLSQRNDSLTKLEPFLKTNDLPEVFLGCEVYYYRTISKSSRLLELCIQNTNYLLLELNYGDIEDCVLTDLENLVYNKGIIPVLAHIERYTERKGFKKILKILESKEVLAHINCAAVLHPKMRKKVLKLIENGYISFIATDTHSLDERPPYMKEALRVIRENLGDSTAEKLIENSNIIYSKIMGDKNEK